MLRMEAQTSLSVRRWPDAGADAVAQQSARSCCLEGGGVRRWVQEKQMSEPVEVVRELYAAVAAGYREATAARMAPHVRWEGHERGPR